MWQGENVRRPTDTVSGLATMQEQQNSRPSHARACTLRLAQLNDIRNTNCPHFFWISMQFRGILYTSVRCAARRSLWSPCATTR